jgi:small subunit ribosomal protein S16
MNRTTYTLLAVAGLLAAGCVVVQEKPADSAPPAPAAEPAPAEAAATAEPAPAAEAAPEAESAPAADAPERPKLRQIGGGDEAQEGAEPEAAE